MQNLTPLPKLAALALDRLLLQYKEYRAYSQQIEMMEKEGGASKEIDLLKRDRQQIGDEMTYANHIVWLAYKYYAYKNSRHAIVTVSDLMGHANKRGDICHERLNFLKKHISTLSDHKDLTLLEFIQLDEVQALQKNTDFLQHWKDNEYHRWNNLVDKWKIKKTDHGMSCEG